MVLTQGLPNIRTFVLFWPDSRRHSIQKNLRREYIKVIWVSTGTPPFIFRVYFGKIPEDPGRNIDSWYFSTNDINQNCLPYTIFYDKGKSCYKGSINFIQIGGSEGHGVFHVIEY